MFEHVKDIIRTPFIDKRIEKYYDSLDESYVSYHNWILQKEKEYLDIHGIRSTSTKWTPKTGNAGSSEALQDNGIHGTGQNVDIVEYFECGTNVLSKTGFTIFVRDREYLSPHAAAVFTEYFETHEQCVLCYGDEDELNSDRTLRMLPWFKPDFSPGLFFDFFYFGNAFAVRNEALLNISWLGDDDGQKNLYDMCLQLAFEKKENMRERMGHVCFVVYHSPSAVKFGREEPYQDLKKKYLAMVQAEDRMVYHFDGTQLQRDWSFGVADKLTSIIIPSKDHPKVLENCLASIKRFSKKERYEIIVVDNGSSGENKEKYEKLMVKYGFNYLYSPMEFNFSAMCNMGAGAARGEFLLFLNDDIEVRQSVWLNDLKQQANRSYVGAVGAKLMYPESNMIQHAGITNILLGPVHKLQFMEDISGSYQYLYDTGRDVLAVTGACLMTRRQVYNLCGGFSEELAVAFNDVELCFRLYEMGYTNVVCNEIHLWHHESLSRGDDESVEKQKRLLTEREKLYAMHPDLYGTDPFYHPYLCREILDTNLSYGYEYPYVPGDCEGLITIRKKPLRPDWENECLIISLEYAGKLRSFTENEAADACGHTKTGTENAEKQNTMYIQGYAFVLEADNSCYDFSVLLMAEDSAIYEAKAKKLYRPDLNKNLDEEYRADMNGFGFSFDKNSLPKGRYRLGVLAKCAVSRQRLYRFTGKYIEI